MAEVFPNIMNMMLTSQYFFIDRFAETPCIAVIDESDAGVTNALWNEFRTKWPFRPYWLLQTPSDGSSPYSGRGSDLDIPADMQDDITNDPLTNAYLVDGYPSGPGTGDSLINRTDGPYPTQTPSDWFNLCNLGSLSAGDSVFLFVDNSGSLSGDVLDGTHDVQPSYDKFIVDCNSAGLIVYLVINNSENYVDPFITWTGARVN